MDRNFQYMTYQENASSRTKPAKHCTVFEHDLPSTLDTHTTQLPMQEE